MEKPEIITSIYLEKRRFSISRANNKYNLEIIEPVWNSQDNVDLR